MQNSNYLSNEKGSGAVCSSKETLHSAELAPGERIDDLQLNGLSLIQSADAFRFGTDSVLLAHFAHVNAKEYCVDLGAGAGALSFLLHGRTGCRILGIEIDARQADRFLRSVRLNGLNEAEITAVNADYIDYSVKSKTKFDCAICNPPYHQHDCGAISQKGAATHDIAAPIKEITKAAAKLLKYALSSAGLEPKRLRLVAGKPEAAPYLALIEAKSGAKSGLIIENNLIIHDENGEYSPEVAEFYGK